MANLKITLVLLFAFNAEFVLSSYLGYPRIHFAGQFRADSNTRNNDRCNYRMNKQLNDDLNSDWGFNGTNEFQFYDTEVTSVVYQDGTTSQSDPIVGRSIVDNLDRPFAKLTDLDTDVQDHSTIYGMNFGVTWDESDSQDLAFYGKWTRSVIAQCMWPRLKCYSPDNAGTELFQDSFPLAGQSTTRITNVNWKDVGTSQALSELQTAANGGDLIIRISIFYYTRNYPPYIAHNATLGYVVGVIGVPGPRDTLNIPGQRSMAFTNFPINLTFEEGDLCYGLEDNIQQFGPWMYTAPFEVDESVIHLDISSSISSKLDNSLRNIGNLRVGVLMETSCVMLLGEEDLPYDDTDALPIHSGIFEIPIESSIFKTLESRPLVMGQYFDNNDGATPICGEFLSVDSPHSMNIILQESEYFIRPNGYYVDRLDHVEKPSTSMSLYVTRYGQPANGVSVQVQSGGTFIPENGIVASSSTATTNNDGIATFQFELGADVTIPAEREYGTSQCSGAADPSDELTLPIEGQVYNFTFCVEVGGKCDATDINFAFLAFSDVEYGDQPNWVDDVEPILAQFARLTAIMKTILDMSSYEDVTKPHNIDLMRKTLLLDFEDPSYMPTTRDLSPVQKNMILRWLDNPIYDSSGTYTAPLAETPVCAVPTIAKKAVSMAKDGWIPLDRCETSLKYREHPEVVDPSFSRLHAPPGRKLKSVPRDRPLLGWALRNNPKVRSALGFDVSCTLDDLKWQLQTAMQLEWSTLPVYLTSLYSIVDGCNTEIYGLIRSVIMQEMLHFTQAANILIAVNGSPLIDDASVTASYPTHLPGQVLPHLVASLKKVSRAHVHNVFMGIELPQKTEVGGTIDTDLYTIGVFYDEIAECIKQLGNDVFDPTTLDKQVQWPWDPSTNIGQVVNVTDVDSSIEAINMIVAQGEGAGLLDPADIDNNTLAHFFQFEEIFCQRHLKKESDDTYSYTGASIPFNKEGVWPMRDNPKASDVLPDTNCYTESKAFHQAYRNLLKKLQAVFNGSPDEIFVAVSLMESLQVHAKRLMWTEFNPDDPTDATTCGPVWDYYWPEED